MVRVTEINATGGAFRWGQDEHTERAHVRGVVSIHTYPEQGTAVLRVRNQGQLEGDSVSIEVALEDLPKIAAAAIVLANAGEVL